MVSMNKLDPPFIFLANNPGVDFTNTKMICRGEVVDLLQTDIDLNKWAQKADLHTEGSEGFHLKPALELRQALRDIFIQKIDNLTVQNKTLKIINQHLLNYSTPQVLEFKNNEYTLRLKYKNLTFSNFLGYLAHESAVLLASSQAKGLKRCNNPDCRLIFVDTSRGQKRRWCSMESCGNRAKAAKHYRKK